MDELAETLKAARALAWKHFQLHATHRIDMFKAYVAFVAIIYAGYGASLQSKYYLVGVSLAVLLIILSAIFYRFDLRIRRLLKIAEGYLIDAERQMGDILRNRNIRLFRKSDLITRVGSPRFRLTYSSLFRGVYFMNVGI